MQILLCALSFALVFIGVITNLFLQTPFNAGTMVVDALYAGIAVAAVFGPLRREAFKALRVPLVLFAILAVWCLGLAAFGDGVLSQRVMGFRNNIVYPGVWLLVGLSAREIGLRGLRETIWYSGLVICAFAIVQAIFHHDLPDCVMLLGHGEDRFGFEGQDIFRPTGLVGNTIVFSGFSAIVLLVGWMRPERKKSFLQKLLTLIPAAALFLTYTRTANVAILLVWGFAWSFFGMKSWWGSILRAGAVLFTLWILISGDADSTPQAAFTKYIKSFFPQKATFVIDRMASQDVSSVGSTNRHLVLFKQGLRLVEEHPVFGVGLGSQGYSSKAPDDICVMRDGYWLATVLEFGIPGTLVWLAFLTWMFFSLMRKANADADDGGVARSLAASMMLVAAYFGITSVLNSSYSARTNQCLLWLCVGALLSNRFAFNAKNGTRRLKFVLNGAFACRRTTGLERFAVETIRALDGLAAPGECVLLIPRRSENPLVDGLKNIDVRRYGLASGFVWEQLCLPFFAWAHGLETVNLCNVAPLANPGSVCIHDIFYKTRARDFGGVRGRLSSAWHRLQYSWCARFATRIFTVSNYSAREISRVYGTTAGRIAVLGNGWEHVRRIAGDDGVLAKVPSGGGFFLTLGSLAPNKNLKWVCRSAKRHPDVTYAVAGGAFASAGRTGCGDTPANMVFLGRVSDCEMKALMERCEALVFPSLEEGFGIPPLEALALGRPVAAAKKSCLPEIYGNAVHWFDPDDPDACDDPRELIKSPVTSAEEVLARHTWRNVASGLLSALRGNDA